MGPKVHWLLVKNFIFEQHCNKNKQLLVQRHCLLPWFWMEKGKQIFEFRSNTIAAHRWMQTDIVYLLFSIYPYFIELSTEAVHYNLFYTAENLVTMVTGRHIFCGGIKTCWISSTSAQRRFIDIVHVHLPLWNEYLNLSN